MIRNLKLAALALALAIAGVLTVQVPAQAALPGCTNTSAICIYKDLNYEGGRKVYYSPQVNLAWVGTNDWATGICNDTGFTITYYQHAQYDGYWQTLRTGYCNPDLRRVYMGGKNWNDQISSISIAGY